MSMKRSLRLFLFAILMLTLSGCRSPQIPSTPAMLVEPTTAPVIQTEPATVEPSATVPATPAVTRSSSGALPDGARWLQHFNQDLLPFWTMEAALGSPLGNFPSTRCNNGAPLDRNNPCPEIKDNPWLMLNRNYVVSMSRQTYGYGVAYHLTGDPRYLAYAKAGVDYLRQNIFDRDNGGTFAYWDGDTKTWQPEPAFRNPQELAYSLLGISFYYYLTHDPQVLPDIQAVKEYIFENYYNPDLNALQWTLASDGETNPLDKRLVAQLDQLNAYMVLITPLLPEPEQTRWKQDMLRLAHIMLDEFYSPEDNLFFLTANTPDEVNSQVAETDFGHTIKAMWMIRSVGLLAGDPELVTFAETNGAKVLSRAYLLDSGAWALSVLQGGAINPDKDWWTYAELDQFASTLALKDPAQASYLPQTTNYYFTYFVDTNNGEVWTAINGATNQPYTDLPKAWPWKSAYHSFEHALVGYITSQQIYDQPVTLYYAFLQPPDPALVRPYFFTGALQQIEKTSVLGNEVYQAQFIDIK